MAVNLAVNHDFFNSADTKYDIIQKYHKKIFRKYIIKLNRKIIKKTVKINSQILGQIYKFTVHIFVGFFFWRIINFEDSIFPLVFPRVFPH